MILILVLLGLGLFVNMIFSAVSAAQIYRSDCSQDSEMKKAYDKNLWTAIISGLGVIAVIAALAVYIYTSRKEIQEQALMLLGGKSKPIARGQFTRPPIGGYQRAGPGQWQKVMMGNDMVEMSTVPQIFATTGVPAQIPQKAPPPSAPAQPPPKKEEGVYFKILGGAAPC